MISTEYQPLVYNGSGSAGPFPVPFPFPANADLIAAVRVGTGGAQILVEGTDYTLTGSGYFTNGGSLTLTVPLAVGSTLTITRVIDLIQPSKFRDLGAFFPQIHEQAFDRLCMMIQQVYTHLNRISVVTGSGPYLPPTSVDTTLGDVVVDLPESGTVTFINGGDMGYSLILQPSVGGQTVLRGENYRMSGFDESVTLSLVDNNWCRISS